MEVLTHFHGWATITWTVLIIPSLLWWRHSIPWLVFLSMWALLATHWGAWQAARSELLTKQEVVTGLQEVAEDVEEFTDE